MSIVKYISAVLFYGQMASVVPHAWKYLFFIDAHCKKLNAFSNHLKITRIFWNLLMLFTNLDGIENLLETFLTYKIGKFFGYCLP